MEINIDAHAPEITWSDDGGTACLTLEVDSIQLAQFSDTTKIRIVHKMPRYRMLYLWSRTDERLYREARAAAEHGTPSDALAEVEAARAAVLRERAGHR